MAVDNVRIRTVPFRDLQAASPQRMAEWLAWLGPTFDYEIILSGHGPAQNIWGTRKDIADHRQYYEDLAKAVEDARAAGHADNSDEMVAAVRAALSPQYGNWTNFQTQLVENVRGAVRWST
jgi:hypothetical protein